MIWIAFIFLFALASVEAGLAYMREILVEDDMRTSAALVGDTTGALTENSALWITTAAQMGLGFILPFALTFVAIPLESFIHSTRTVMGTVLVAVLRAVEWLLRFLGNLARSSGKIFVHVYDVLIIIPIGIEKLFKNNKEGSKETAGAKVGGVV